MENRDLYNKKRNRKKNRIKKKKRLKTIKRLSIFLIVILLAFLLLTYAVGFANKLINNRQKDVSNEVNDPELVQETINQEDLSLSLDEPEKTSEKKKSPVDTNITFEMKKVNLEDRINEYLSNKKIDKEGLSIGYYGLDSKEMYTLNADNQRSVGRADNFILAMAINDLANEQGINLEDKIEHQTEKEKKSSLNSDDSNDESAEINEFAISYMMAEAIKGDRDFRNTLRDFLEEKTGKSWNQAINVRYGISISDENKLNAQDGLKMLKLLFASQKEDSENLENVKEYNDYSQIVSMMVTEDSSTNITKDTISKLEFSQAIGYDYVEYGTMGYVLNGDRYVFVVLSNHNDPSIMTEVVSLINSWNNYYSEK